MNSDALLTWNFFLWCPLISDTPLYSFGQLYKKLLCIAVVLSSIFSKFQRIFLFLGTMIISPCSCYLSLFRCFCICFINYASKSRRLTKIASCVQSCPAQLIPRALDNSFAPHEHGPDAIHSTLQHWEAMPSHLVSTLPIYRLQLEI